MTRTRFAESAWHLPRTTSLWGLALTLFSVCGLALAGDFVAGTQPDRRPENAPTIESVRAEDRRAAESVHGITPPVPDSILRAIESQGAWHTPLSHPGMPKPYDIRGWHKDASEAARDKQGAYFRAAAAPIHLPGHAGVASDSDCLACHIEVLEDTVSETSPAGVKASESIAWYQTTLSVYEGPQDTFHRRHLTTPMAKELMNLQCSTCHEGHDPRDETVGSSADGTPLDSTAFVLRKTINPETSCLKCHGQFNSEVMGLPGPWHQTAEMMGNDCMVCHVAFRTERHQVSYLKADAIEAAGKENADSCYGCHGGRAWYGISYPYPRNAWPGMAEEVPEWAKSRPTESEARFQIKQQTKN